MTFYSRCVKAAAKLKDCEALKEWQHSIVNHIYWVAGSTSDGDCQLMVEKWQSVANHIIISSSHKAVVLPMLGIGRL